MENVPTDVVQSKYFRAMLNSFDSNAAPPSINKVKDHQFQVLAANIRQAQLVTTSGCFVTITCDHWTSVAKQSYWGMTAHWIDKDFKFHSCTMGCWLHEGGSTADDLRDDKTSQGLFKRGSQQDLGWTSSKCNTTLPASWWYSTNCPAGADQPDKPGSYRPRYDYICQSE
jgi:hypothetical protein